MGIFIDLRNTFGTVDHDILEKLEHCDPRGVIS